MSETEAAIAKAVADVMQKSAAVGEESMLIEATIVKCGWTEVRHTRTIFTLMVRKLPTQRTTRDMAKVSPTR